MSDGRIQRLESALAGRYRIQHKLGEGGMATVYLAQDLRHERKVALKVLKPELAAVLGAERFLAEIKTTANLQHPHILPLFDSGEADGFLFYVMPFVEDETLRDRLRREKQLPVDEAVRIARSVAGALHAAHEAGVIHRDVKPENILLSRGEPLVADFGIALAVSQAGGGRLTETGLSLGTPYYMSPEQATADRDPGRASDVYSLGCVLYEMLVGDPPHTGSSAQAVLAKILTEEPRAVTAIRKTVPLHVADAVARSLERLPADRFETADAFARALADPGFRHTVAGTAADRAAGARPPPADGARPRQRLTAGLPWIVAAAAVVAAAAGWLGREAAGGPGPLHLTMDMGVEEFTGEMMLAVSPDGRSFAVTGREGDSSPIYVRTAEDPEWRALPGTGLTEGGAIVSFSPDGRRLAVIKDRALTSVSVEGGNPITLVRSEGAIYEPHWGENGDIVYVGGKGVMRLHPESGAVDTVAADRSGSFPFLMPDGAAVFHHDFDSPRGGILVTDLETDSTRQVIDEGRRPVYLSSGHLLYVHPDGGLLVRPFDARTLQVTGPPVPVLDDVGQYGFSLSRTGTLVVRTGLRPGSQSDTRFLLLGPGAVVDTLRLPARHMRTARISPDGTQMAFALVDRQEDGPRLYLYDLARRTGPVQFTFDGLAGSPVWSPDGSRIAFRLIRDERFGIAVKPAVGAGPEALVFQGDATEGGVYPSDWTGDGRIVFDMDSDGGSSSDILLVPASGGGDTTAFLRTDFPEYSGQLSPDGRWAAYVSRETGSNQVYVRRFPGAEGQQRVTRDGGFGPNWSPDGRSLYYMKRGTRDTLYAVDVELEPRFSVSEPRVVRTAGLIITYDLHPDGQRVLVGERIVPEGEEGAEPPPDQVVVIVNWLDGVLRRLAQQGGR